MNKKVYEIAVEETIVRKIQIVADNEDEAFDKYLEMDNGDTTITYQKSYNAITNNVKQIGEFNYNKEDYVWEPSNKDVLIRI